MVQSDLAAPSADAGVGTSLSESVISIHLLLIWILTLVFCWKVFPAIFNSALPSEPSKNPDKAVSKTSPKKSVSSPQNTPVHFQSPLQSPPLASIQPVRQKQKQCVSTNKKLISQLQVEACTKAKEAGKHPSFTSLVLSLVHHYNLDVNKPVLSNSFTIFHCSCQSGSLDLVTSLSPMAKVHLLTDKGESPLHLAVNEVVNKHAEGAGPGEAGMEVVKHLLQAGCDVNQATLSGLTALHQASRQNCPELVRLLLDWGADPKAGKVDTSLGRNMSVINRCSSVVTRAMSRKVEKDKNVLDKSFKLNETIPIQRNY